MHNAVLRSAVKEVPLHYFGFTSWTKDLTAAAMGFGKHADAHWQLTFDSDYQCMPIVSGQANRTRPLLIDVSIVNTAAPPTSSDRGWKAPLRSGRGRVVELDALSSLLLLDDGAVEHFEVLHGQPRRYFLGGRPRGDYPRVAAEAEVRR